MEVSGDRGQWCEGGRWVGRRKGGRYVGGGGRRFPKRIGVKGGAKKNMVKKNCHQKKKM
jgi:hypothetical protein